MRAIAVSTVRCCCIERLCFPNFTAMKKRMPIPQCRDVIEVWHVRVMWECILKIPTATEISKKACAIAVSMILTQEYDVDACFI